MKKEKIGRIKKTEIEGYKEQYLSDCWRTWNCYIEIHPDGNWDFWFSLPKKEKDGKIKKEEVYLTQGLKLYIRASEILYNETGEKIEKRPLFTTVENLNKMVEHAKKIVKKFIEKYDIG